MNVKARAVIEAAVVFSLTLALVALAGLSAAGRMERQVTDRPFIEYSVMVLLPLLLLIVARRSLASYGLSLRSVPYHLDVAATAFVPVAMANAPLAFIDHRRWNGALILAGVQIVALCVLARLLKGKPTRNEGGFLAGAILMISCSGFAPGATLGNAISALVFYVLFLGLGEELLFRGYIQSRLNAAFGRPYRFHGVDWGWGVVIASGLFGLMHVLNLGSLVSGDWGLAWWWGFWTFFGGLVLGFLREKTGGIVAPAILHGLPQAIAYSILGL
jgi:hypothetical protein